MRHRQGGHATTETVLILPARFRAIYIGEER